MFLYLSIVVHLIGISTGDVYAGETVLLESGRTVYVVFMSVLHPEDVSEGSEVQLTLARNVKVRDALVLRKGTLVTGQVVKLQKRGFVGKPDEIKVEIKYVTDSNEVKVPVFGEYSISGSAQQVESLGITLFYCIFGIFIRGEETHIAEGTMVSCRVLSDTYLAVKPGDGN